MLDERPIDHSQTVSASTICTPCQSEGHAQTRKLRAKIATASVAHAANHEQERTIQDVHPQRHYVQSLSKCPPVNHAVVNAQPYIQALEMALFLRHCSSYIVLTRTVQPVATCPNRHMSISQLLSSRRYLFTVLNSSVLFYTRSVSTTPTTPSQPRPLPSPTHCRRRHIPNTFLNSSAVLLIA